MLPFTDTWEITPATAHPRARQLLGDDSIVRNYADGDSPLGNVIGADVFASYLKFRVTQPYGSVRQVLSDELDAMEISDDAWDLPDPADLQVVLDSIHGFSFLLRDDVVIGLAFAQLLVEGTIDAEVLRLALLANQRQATAVVLSFRADDPSEMKRWKIQLAEFRSILERV